MSESGGRRMKRSLTIDLSTIRFLSQRDIERFANFRVLADYMAEKQKVLAADLGTAMEGEPVVNHRRLTNIGTFRAYVICYLRQNPQIHDKMTFLVRQLQPTDVGLPIEIYLFTRTTVWAEYEAIQADIFDHLLAVLPEFGLRAFQRPSGADFAGLAVAGEHDGSGAE
jgi:miniconductance mechanosensitive channel